MLWGGSLDCHVALVCAVWVRVFYNPVELVRALFLLCYTWRRQHWARLCLILFHAAHENKGEAQSTVLPCQMWEGGNHLQSISEGLETL